MKKLFDKIAGTKYYIIVCYTGTEDFISSTIFSTHNKAMQFALELKTKGSLKSYKVASFRTKEPLVLITGK